MTRFMISLDDAVQFVWQALKDMKGGEIYIKKDSVNESYRYSFVY